MASGGSHSSASEVIAYEKTDKPVKLVYDTWTPRPHFIVVQHTPKSDANSAELEETFKIIDDFLRENTAFDQDAILSFHRGEWYQQNTGHWHAHLCVPYGPYLKQAATQVI